MYFKILITTKHVNTSFSCNHLCSFAFLGQALLLLSVLLSHSRVRHVTFLSIFLQKTSPLTLSTHLFIAVVAIIVNADNHHIHFIAGYVFILRTYCWGSQTWQYVSVALINFILFKIINSTQKDTGKTVCSCSLTHLRLTSFYFFFKC